MLGIMAGMVSFDPLYLTVTCSEFARGVQGFAFFWKLTSGWFPYSALLGWTVDTCVRQSTSSCFLLVAMHLALCSLACRPFVAHNSGSTRLVLLGTMHLALYSLFPSSGPRCATSWPVWTRRTENSPVAPQQAPCLWQSLVRCWSCLRCTGSWTVLGDDSRNGFRIQHSLVRQWIQVRRQFTRLVGKISHGCSSWTRLLICPLLGKFRGMAQTVHSSCSSWTMSLICLLCPTAGALGFKSRKLWRFRSCSSLNFSTRSLTSLLWRRCRFPLSLQADHRDSPAAVHR